MIKVFTGEDTKQARKSAREAFERAREENPEALVSYWNDVNFDETNARDAWNSENLFGGQNILFFDGILDHPDGESFYRTGIEKTGHIVIIRETVLPKELSAFLERIGEIKEFTAKKIIKKPENNFAIADAVGRKDKKEAWVLFTRASQKGVAMEELHGMLFWAFKNMYICATENKDVALKTGMKDFTFRNYLQFSKRYLVPELKQKLGELKEMYHRAHRGESLLEIEIEQFLLKL